MLDIYLVEKYFREIFILDFIFIFIFIFILDLNIFRILVIENLFTSREE